MVYLETFYLPIEKEEQIIRRKMAENGGPFGYIDNVYPCGLFSEKQLYEINFDTVTIFYGGNGSGKSTLLNLLAQRIKLDRVAPFNSGELVEGYVCECEYRLGVDDEGDECHIPQDSSIITSDDIFDYMLAVRSNNQEIAECQGEAKEDWSGLKYGNTIKFNGLQDYERVRAQVLARSKSLSRRQFIKKMAGEEVRLNSNGETALEYFKTRLRNDTLYLLDEPENSMSPKMQLELVVFLEKMARYCGTQFVIATHSPFLLAMQGARIYDLDSCPVCISDWWELENVKIYYEFFKKHERLFE